jgi:hypothetical protein
MALSIPVRKEHGGILVDGRQVASTLQCVHCNKHWVMRPGSGITRGWCLRCSGPLCGAKHCVETCVPFEALLDHAEGRRSRWTDTIIEEGLVL